MKQKYITINKERKVNLINLFDLNDDICNIELEKIKEYDNQWIKIINCIPEKFIGFTIPSPYVKDQYKVIHVSSKNNNLIEITLMDSKGPISDRRFNISEKRGYDDLLCDLREYHMFDLKIKLYYAKVIEFVER